MLDRTAETVKQHQLANVRFVRSTERDPKLPPQSVDVVFIAHSYHEFGDPETMMEGVRRSLKPGGRLVIVEYAKEKKLAPASTLHKMSFERSAARSSRWDSSWIGSWISCRRSTG
jgi:Methylase involved in ubiquinone/menaquinone biosynthesis